VIDGKNLPEKNEADNKLKGDGRKEEYLYHHQYFD
jgi:hypothetical protein